MQKILEDIRSGSFRQLYLLYGEEAWLRKDYKNRLVNALFPEKDEMNFSRFQGKDVSVDEVISLAETLPFFAERRVILLEDTGLFKSADEGLADYLKSLPEYLVIIFSEEAVDKRGRLYKAAAKLGRTAEFSRLPADKLSVWAAGVLKNSGRKIRSEDAKFLIARVGDDMGLIRTELEKLICYTEGRGLVTREDIETMCAPRLQDRVFDMIRAIAEKDQTKALDLYSDLLALKEAPVKILVLMGRQYSQLHRARLLQGSSLGRAELASRIGISPYFVRSTMECASRYSPSELREAIRDVVETDEAVKSGRIQDRLAVELLIIRRSRD